MSDAPVLTCPNEDGWTLGLDGRACSKAFQGGQVRVDAIPDEKAPDGWSYHYYPIWNNATDEELIAWNQGCVTDAHRAAEASVTERSWLLVGDALLSFPTEAELEAASQGARGLAWQTGTPEEFMAFQKGKMLVGSTFMRESQKPGYLRALKHLSHSI